MESSIEAKEIKEKPLFKDLHADDDEPEATEIESLCVACEETVWMENQEIFLPTTALSLLFCFVWFCVEFHFLND